MYKFGLYLLMLSCVIALIGDVFKICFLIPISVIVLLLGFVICSIDYFRS